MAPLGIGQYGTNPATGKPYTFTEWYEATYGESYNNAGPKKSVFADPYGNTPAGARDPAEQQKLGGGGGIGTPGRPDDFLAGSSGKESATNASDIVNYWNRTGSTSQMNPSAWQYNEGVSPAYQAERARIAALGDQQNWTPEQRANSAAARLQQGNALAMLQDYATGKTSIAQQQGAMARQSLQNQMASSLASKGYDPAAARGGQMAYAKGAADLGQKTAIAAAQEKLAATNAYMAGAGTMRAGDQSQLGQEAAIEASLRGYGLAKDTAEQQWQKLGLGEKLAEASFAQDWQKQQQAAQQWALSQALRAEGKEGGGGTDWSSILGGAASAAGGIAALFSDVNAKMPPDGQYGHTGIDKSKPYWNDPARQLGIYGGGGETHQAPWSSDVEALQNTAGGWDAYQPDKNNLPQEQYIPAAPAPITGGGSWQRSPTQTVERVVPGGGSSGPAPHPTYYQPQQLNRAQQQSASAAQRGWVLSDAEAKQAEAAGAPALAAFWRQVAAKRSEEQASANPFNSDTGQVETPAAPGGSTLGKNLPLSVPAHPTTFDVNATPTTTTTVEDALSTPEPGGVNPTVSLSGIGKGIGMAVKGALPYEQKWRQDINSLAPLGVSASPATSLGSALLSDEKSKQKASALDSLMGPGSASPGTAVPTTANTQSVAALSGVSDKNRDAAWRSLVDKKAKIFDALTEAGIFRAAPGSQPNPRGSGLEASDARIREEIDSRADARLPSAPGGTLDEFMSKIRPVQFQYRPQFQGMYGDGERLGVVAQDVDGSKLGKGMTMRDPETGLLMLDTRPDKFNPLVLASLSRLSKRLDKVEK